MNDLSHLEGWAGIDATQIAIASSYFQFSAIAPNLMADSQGTSDPILLYKAFKDVLKGSYPQYKAQEIGDCTSHSTGHGSDLLQCIEIVLGGEASEYREVSTEAIYAVGRECANMLRSFSGDGCYGAAIVKGMQEIGLVTREMLGDDGAYSGRRAKQWGRTGMPKSVREMASKYKLGGAALVKTWDELVAALKNGYPVAVCSNYGFTMTRDSQGFCDPRGTWNHSMLLTAVRFDREGANCWQSWGPKTPSGPIDLDQPEFSFWIDRRPIERMLGQGDSFTLSKAPNFVERKLPKNIDWSIAA
jgi:hypothetical protein